MDQIEIILVFLMYLIFFSTFGAIAIEIYPKSCILYSVIASITIWLIWVVKVLRRMGLGVEIRQLRNCSR